MAGDRSAPAFERGCVAVGAAVFVLLMALSPWYGFHRDELYFLDAGRHLQGAYVDQPVFAPLLARLSLELFGVSLPGLRLWPALAGWTTVVLAGMVARECGGSRRAQLLAAVSVATMPVLLAVDHNEGPTAFDMLAWTALALVVLRIGRTGGQRLWLLAGAITGVGLANKHSIAFFALAILCGAILGGGRRSVLNRWVAAGAGIAALFTLPDLIWQAQHGWATIEMTRHLNQENGGLGNIGSWISGQFLMSSLALLAVWIAGLRFLWRSRRPLWRALVWAYAALFVFFALTTGAKIYYLAGAYVYLLAAGAVAIESWLSARPLRLRLLLAATVVTTIPALLIVLPILPARDTGWFYSINQQPGESIGWNDFVREVAGAWSRVPLRRRAGAVIFTVTYGEAGAINELGRGRLPGAISDQNSEWWWGPGNPHAQTVLAVAPGPLDVTGYGAYLRRYFASVRVLATLSNRAGIHNQEWGGHVYLCGAPREPWGLIWPQLRHYD
jgi:4-amino-4-deoxy-L-arabinose transferase-like glycosyltransferase